MTKVDFKWLRPKKKLIDDKVLHGGKTLLFMASLRSKCRVSPAQVLRLYTLPVI